MTKTSFKKLDLIDLAIARIKNSSSPASASVGDLIEIIEPFMAEENYVGVVIEINETHIFVYHGALRKTLMWNRCVNCVVTTV